MPELPPEIDEDPKAAVVRLLRSRDPQAMPALQAWVSQQEERVRASEGDHRMAQIELALTLARLYLEAGYSEESSSSYGDAALQALQEGRDDLRARIEDEAAAKGLEIIYPDF